jgi:hypothetical protein
MGLVPFVVGVWLCVRNSWKHRGGPLGITPFILLAGVLAMSLGSEIYLRKITWLILALAAGSATNANGPLPGKEANANDAPPQETRGDWAW